MAESLCAGIDGCRKGWVVVSLHQSRPPQINLKSSISDFFSSVNNVSRVFIDMPIGLPFPAVPVRRCDMEVRKLLKSRRSSVFSPPCREAVYASDYAGALQINREFLGKGFSKQAWNICNKIKEVDSFLHENPDLQETLIEAHPELCFKKMNKGELKYTKKDRSGERERIRLINRFFPKGSVYINEFVRGTLRKEVQADDVIDAFCLAIHASLSAKRGVTSIPDHPDFDEAGLPMQICHAASLH